VDKLAIHHANIIKEKGPSNFHLSLTYPVGYSPKVFTTGWVFGARCIVDTADRRELDLSGSLFWKGTGTFWPDRGPMSFPTFNKAGTNQITLYFKDKEKVVFEKTFTVETVDPKGYARYGDLAQAPPHAHGCPSCPHPVVGPIIGGSNKVLVGGKPAACVGDMGVHAACCGANTYVIKTGDPNVLIQGRQAARLNDQTVHCGFAHGRIISAYGK
jgi:uncharacterized Zn-binding protein involved in type VI secretion